MARERRAMLLLWGIESDITGYACKLKNVFQQRKLNH